MPKHPDPLKTRKPHFWLFWLSLPVLVLGLFLLAATDAGADWSRPRQIIGQLPWFTSDSTISGVKINLILNGTVVTSTVSDANGYWQFSNLGYNTWTIQVDPDNFLPGHALYGKQMTGSACGITPDNSCTLTTGNQFGFVGPGFTFGPKPPAYGGPIQVDKTKIKTGSGNAVEAWINGGISLYRGQRSDQSVLWRTQGITNTGAFDVGTFQQIAPQPTINVTEGGTITPTGTFQPIASASTIQTATLDLGDANLVLGQFHTSPTPVALPTPTCPLDGVSEQYPGYCALAGYGDAITQTYTIFRRWSSELVLENAGNYPITVAHGGTVNGAWGWITTIMQPGEAHELWYDQYRGWLDPSQ